MERAFWDVYYEHCSYFSAGSLARTFRRAGFRVTDVRREYDGQYVAVEAEPATGPSPALQAEDDLERIAALVSDFERDVRNRLSWWRERLDAWRDAGRRALNSRRLRAIAEGERLDAWRDAGRRVVLWGSGSKGVSFLTTLGGRPEIEEVVDINPHKHGYYMAGSGQRIVGPDRLTERPPNVVLVMNPIYRDEIQADLDARQLHPEVIAL